MGWVLLTLRQSELQSSINDLQYNLIQISSQMTKLSNFSSAIADGNITPTEIASIDSELFGDALDFMGYSKDIAIERAEEQTSLYATAYEDATQDQLINAGMALYTTEDGTLDEDALYEKFYQQALKEFAEDYYMPLLNEKDQELQEQKTEMETELESKEAELQTVKNSKSQEIQNNTIKLS